MTKMRKDIPYKWYEGGGFLIRYREEFDDYELIEVPIGGGQEERIGLFLSVDEAKKYADILA